MPAETNPYAAPQTINITMPPTQLAGSEQHKFPSSLVWQSLLKGAITGPIASLAMMFVFVLKIGEEKRGALPHLLTICGWFVAATSTLGVFWGLNHAVIVWCLQRWPTEMRN
jgi:hypothetical protein